MIDWHITTIAYMLGFVSAILFLVALAFLSDFLPRRVEKPEHVATVIPFRRKRSRAKSARFRGGL